MNSGMGLDNILKRAIEKVRSSHAGEMAMEIDITRREEDNPHEDSL